MNRKYIPAIICLLVLLGISFFLFVRNSPTLPQEEAELHTGPINRADDLNIPAHVQPYTQLSVNPSLEIDFSHPPGFYSMPFHLTIYAPEGATIHYTLDGSLPTVNSPIHESPMRISAPSPGAPVTRFDSIATSRVTVYSINAIAILDGQVSEVFTSNFVTGTDVHTRFCENTLIFVLNSDPHGLFDHYDGIAVEGIDREIFRQEFFDTHERWPVRGYSYGYETPASPANFNRRGREAERPVHVQIFDHAGELHISQRAGIRVRGGFSRAAEPQKSFELLAREEYGDRNNFRFSFFGDVEHAYDGQYIDRYRRVRLRNGGTDRNSGFIRDELSHVLFRQAGHSDTQLHTPAAVFLNGEYYGVAWLKSPRTENHLRRRYGGITAGFEIVAGGDNHFTYSWWTGNHRATSDLHQVSELARQGFAGEDGQVRFEEFSSRIDVDALIRYYAMQIYINNVDWPNHNIEMWRYFPTEEERNDPDLHPYLRDGRWRVFAHDLEAAWSMWDDENRMAREDTIRDIMTGDNPNRWNSHNSSAFLYAILSREDTTAQFANTFIDLIEGAFSPANIEAVLDDLIAKIQNELHYALRMNLFYQDNEWWPNPDSMRYSHEAIRRFAHIRPNYIYLSIFNNLGFNWEHRFSITTSTGAGGAAVMNSRPVEELQMVTGNYFAGTSIRIMARPNAGYEVEYWLVNGAQLFGDYIIVSEESNVFVNFRPINL